jgi:hypothetical protein
VKLSWCLQVNGRQLACLPPDEADTISYLPIPAGALRDGDNELRVATAATTATATATATATTTTTAVPSMRVPGNQ